MGTVIGSSFLNSLCASYNGVDEHMITTPTSEVRNGTSGAWSMWVRIPATFTVDQVGICLGMGADGVGRLNFGVRRIGNTGTSTYFTFSYTNASGTFAYSATTTALAANTWYHVVFQSTGSAWQVFVNGVAQTLTQWAGTTSNSGDWFGDMSGSNARMTTGVNYAAGAIGTVYFNGRLDEVTYFNRSLSSAEVSWLYNGGTRRNVLTDPDLNSAARIWWRLGDSRDSATTVFDELTTNDLTLVNMDTSNYVAP